jgi:quinoprotein glucose dehydrogenase
MQAKLRICVTAATLLGGAGLVAAQAGTDWQNYGGDRGAQRYSPLTQITPANVSSLKVAWTYHMKPADATRGATSQTTPLVVQDARQYAAGTARHGLLAG